MLLRGSGARIFQENSYWDGNQIPGLYKTCFGNEILHCKLSAKSIHKRKLKASLRVELMEIVEVGNCEVPQPQQQALPLLSLNHVSLLCRSVWDSVRFYEDVLGFVPIKRPSSFNFSGAWLAYDFLFISIIFVNYKEY